MSATRTQIYLTEEQRDRIDVIVEADRLIDELIHGGAPMREEEKPRNSTLLQSLELLQRRGVLVEDDDRYFANADSTALLNYYANSIAHWLRPVDAPIDDQATNADMNPGSASAAGRTDTPLLATDALKA